MARSASTPAVTNDVAPPPVPSHSSSFQSLSAQSSFVSGASSPPGSDALTPPDARPEKPIKPKRSSLPKIRAQNSIGKPHTVPLHYSYFVFCLITFLLTFSKIS